MSFAKSHFLTCFLISGMIVLTGGCANRSLSPMQKRQITSRQIEGSYEDVYRATMTVLQDQEYIIKNTDMASGLIVASVDREASRGSQLFAKIMVGYVARKGTFVEATVTVGEINETLQEVRMNLQETRYDKRGNKRDIKQILQPEPYRELANQITVETKRREALGR